MQYYLYIYSTSVHLSIYVNLHNIWIGLTRRGKSTLAPRWRSRWSPWLQAHGADCRPRRWYPPGPVLKRKSALQGRKTPKTICFPTKIEASRRENHEKNDEHPTKTACLVRVRGPAVYTPSTLVVYHDGAIPGHADEVLVAGTVNHARYLTFDSFWALNGLMIPRHCFKPSLL